MLEYSQLIDLARQTIRRRSLSCKTENAYINHIRRFLEFHGNCDLLKGKADKILAFLTDLGKKYRYAASTINQARCALLFFYRDVLEQKLSPSFDLIKRARPPEKLPAIFSHEEAKAVLSALHGAPFLAAAFMYGSGLRLPEAVRLRVRDINFEDREIVVREHRTGAKMRTTILPNLIVPALQRHLTRVNFTFEDDCFLGYGKVWLPNRVRQKYPQISNEWLWQYVFPSAKLSYDKTNDTLYRHHLAESTVQKAFAEALKKVNFLKPEAGCQTLRYSFAVRLFERNNNVHTIQNLLGHKNLKTTMTYLNFRGNGRESVTSPLDF